METTSTTTTTTSNDIFLCNSPWDIPTFSLDHHHLLLPLDFSPSFPDLPLPCTYTHHHQEEDEEEEEEEEENEENEEEKLGPMKEMMYKVAAMQPVDIDPTTVRRPRRRNVRISDDPQSVAARHRRQRISERLRILQRLVPGGSKLDTASMLDEAVRYVKFLKRQIRILQSSRFFSSSSTSTSSSSFIAPAAAVADSALCNNNL